MEQGNGIDLSNGNSGPWIFLAARQVNALNLQRACQLFQVETKKIENEVIFFSKDKTLNHKEKSLILFYTALYLGSTNKEASFCLGQYDVLGESIKAGDLRARQKNINELQSSDWKDWTPKNGEVWISEYSKIYLQHAGIQLQKSEVSIVDWVQSEFSRNKNVELKKVG
jgi:hypothetical protein